MAREDRDSGGGGDGGSGGDGYEEAERHRSSSHKDKSSRKESSSSSSKRDKEKDRSSDRGAGRESRGDGDKSGGREGGKSSRSSKHSRKRDRSEDGSGSSHAKDKDHHPKERSSDRSHGDDDDHKRRRREDSEKGHGSSRSSHKSKHRDKDGKGGGGSSSSRHKDKGRKEKRKDKHRSKDERVAEDPSGSNGTRKPNGVSDGVIVNDGGETNGHASSVLPSLVAGDMTDGEEEGELVFEPKKPDPAPTADAPATPADTNGGGGGSGSGSGSGSGNDNGIARSKLETPTPSNLNAEVLPPPVDDEQAEEAARIARIAARAEERAAERAKARAAAAAAAAAPGNGNAKFGGPSSGIDKGSGAGKQELGVSRAGSSGGSGTTGNGAGPMPPGKLAFKTKKQREQEALQRLEEQRITKRREQEAAAAERGTSERQRQQEEDRRRQKARETEREEARAAREKEKELEVFREQYLGKKKVKKKIVKPSEKFSKIFQFDWDASEDTSRDSNPLYSQRAQLNTCFGRGYLAGIDMREQRKDSAFLTALMQKRQEEQRRVEDADQSLSAQDKADRERLREQQMAEVAAISRAEADGLGDDPVLKGAHWSEKPLVEMTNRDWRIFMEDFDIRVKGGKAPLPLRFWEEGHLPSSVMEAIRDLGYEKPSPIQRQAIPIGMERRDIIGIAETGSGKTAAFGIPMIAYILSCDAGMRDRVAEQGPLALIMAPTRELAIQIEEECKKFCKFAGLNTVCVVGGQNIETQAFTLRKGVEIIIGTPGRLNDCVEKHYLVLNQCNYVVLDEADRMIDMGFEEQVLAVLDAMGGTLKADNAELAYEQEKKAKEARNAKDLVRVTAMFSATMPPAVEKMAKKYLRHPAIVQIGDEDTGKNRRIEQRVLWMTEAQKKTKVVELLRGHDKDDRVLVFTNTKTGADLLGRQLDQAGFATVVLHGGKTQDQREENLESFRDGVYTVLVATDVASRGLDIPDVKEVINYELPNKIETYCHRIGRTGRAGKDGVATSFLTEHDEEIMFGLKEYLQSTESHVPQQLMKHSAAQAAVGTRRDDGSLVNSKRDTVMFSKK